MIRPEKLRRDFPILSTKVSGRRLVYLDNAATTQKPRQVLDAIRDYYSRDNANAHRSAHFLAGRATAALEGSREKVASFIGASPREAIFVRNATEALNLVAGSWGRANFSRGDEVLLSAMEHHSNLVPWQAFQKRGVKLVFSPALSDGSFDYEAFEANLSKKTKLVAITQKSNVLGTTLDARRICKAARDNGSTVLLDGAQSVPSM
jgi:cysteine desulfurase/selenocysteine lyase